MEQPLSEHLQQHLEFQGVVAFPGDELYKSAIARAWNWRVRESAHPRAIFFATGTRDVVQLVRYATANKLRLSVLNGGMNPSGRSLDGDVVLVLPSGCSVDPIKKVAHIAAGSLWSHVDWELSLWGLCVPAPIVQSIGVAGSSLGGGWGYVSKEHGMTCDSILEAEVVLASGEVLVANRSSNPDLFWCVTRGAGAGTVGVVSRLDLRLYDAPKSVYHGLLGWPAAAHTAQEWKALATALLAHRNRWPKNFICYPVLLGLHVLLMVYCPAGRTTAHSLMSPLFDAVGQPTVYQDCRDKSYLEAQRFTEATFPSQRAFMESRFVVLTEDIFAVAVAHMELQRAADKNRTRIVLQNYFGQTEEVYHLLVSAQWDKPEDDAGEVEWVRAMVAKVPQELGAAVNFSSRDASVDDLFGEDDVARLTRIKKKYDPTGFWKSSFMK